MSETSGGPSVHGLFPLWVIVIRQPKDPEDGRKSMTPDPRKPTTQAPEMVERGKIPILRRKADGNLLTRKEAEEFLRDFVQKNRHRFPENYSYSLELINFYDMEGEGAPEVSFAPCPKHPDAKEPPSNCCGHCGGLREVILKTTP